MASSDGNLLSYSLGISDVDLTVQNDYDGDGKTDVAVWRRTNGTFCILRSSDAGTTSVQWGKDGDYPIAVYDTH